MNDSYPAESQLTLNLENLTPKYVHELEGQMFPELAGNGSTVHMSEITPDLPLRGLGPAFYFEQGLWNADFAEKLTEDTKLLSIGAGRAYVEQFLTKYTDLQPSNVTLSDIEPVEPPEGFNHKLINMDDTDWGVEENTYDVIWFPNSISFASICWEYRKIHRNNPEYWEAPKSIVTKALKYVRNGGEIRFNHSMPNGKIDDSVLSNFDAFINANSSLDSSCTKEKDTFIFKVIK